MAGSAKMLCSSWLVTPYERKFGRSLESMKYVLQWWCTQTNDLYIAGSRLAQGSNNPPYFQWNPGNTQTRSCYQSLDHPYLTNKHKTTFSKRKIWQGVNNFHEAVLQAMVSRPTASDTKDSTECVTNKPWKQIHAFQHTVCCSCRRCMFCANTITKMPCDIWLKYKTFRTIWTFVCLDVLVHVHVIRVSFICKHPFSTNFTAERVHLEMNTVGVLFQSLWCNKCGITKSTA